MSRIGRKPVALPAGVEIKVEGNVITVKGPKGELSQEIGEQITAKIEENELIFTRPSDTKEDKAQHGLARALVNNMVTGVTTGFQKTLKIVGVGYRAEKQGNKLVMSLGYSHPVEMEDPEGLETKVEENKIIVSGIDKEKVGQYAAEIRSTRTPEPYKGKGIKYDYEVIRRKVGKAGKK